MMILEIPQQNLNVKLINDHCSPRLKYNSNVYLKSYYNKSTTLLYKHFFSIYSSFFIVIYKFKYTPIFSFVSFYNYNQC